MLKTLTLIYYRMISIEYQLTDNDTMYDIVLKEMEELFIESKSQAFDMEKKLCKIYMVLDIETARTGEIIQIAYNMYDGDFRKIKYFNKIINEGIGKVDFYGKITQDIIEKHGSDPIDVLLEVIFDLQICDVVIGHNISFDMSRIYRYCDKYCINIDKKPKQICTMYLSKHLCCLKNVKGSVKTPKLSELYMYCFGCLPDETKTHSANYDVDITFLCFYHLYKNGKIAL